MLWRNAWPVILDAEQRSLRGPLPADANFGPRRGVVHRVIDQVGDGAAQLLLITQHLELLIDGEDQRLFLLAESLRLALHHPQHHRHVDAIIHRQRRRGFNTRQRQQLLHQTFHTLSLLPHGVQGFFSGRPLQHLLLHHLQIALQHRQWGA